LNLTSEESESTPDEIFSPIFVVKVGKKNVRFPPKFFDCFSPLNNIVKITCIRRKKDPSMEGFVFSLKINELPILGSIFEGCFE